MSHYTNLTFDLKSNPLLISTWMHARLQIKFQAQTQLQLHCFLSRRTWQGIKTYSPFLAVKKSKTYSCLYHIMTLSVITVPCAHVPFITWNIYCLNEIKFIVMVFFLFCFFVRPTVPKSLF